MASPTTSPGFPWGMTILFVLAVLLYGPFIANILTARSSDAAGRGMSLGFAVIQGLVLWIVLAAGFAAGCSASSAGVMGMNLMRDDSNLKIYLDNTVAKQNTVGFAWPAPAAAYRSTPG